MGMKRRKMKKKRFIHAKRVTRRTMRTSHVMCKTGVYRRRWDLLLMRRRCRSLRYRKWSRPERLMQRQRASQIHGQATLASPYHHQARLLPHHSAKP
jgi:hypothetical protein